MKFYERLNALAEKARREATSIEAQEATRTDLILPFIQNVLEFTADTPGEIVEGYTCSTSAGKVEKVDYAISKTGRIQVLIKCIQFGERLTTEHVYLLARMHNANCAQLSILTNGQHYRFFAASELHGRMDKVPFLTLDLLNADMAAISKLKRLATSHYRLTPAVDTTEDLDYARQINWELQQQIKRPEEDFLLHLCRAGL